LEEYCKRQKEWTKGMEWKREDAKSKTKLAATSKVNLPHTRPHASANTSRLSMLNLNSIASAGSPDFLETPQSDALYWHALSHTKQASAPDTKLT